MCWAPRAVAPPRAFPASSSMSSMSSMGYVVSPGCMSTRHIDNPLPIRNTHPTPSALSSISLLSSSSSLPPFYTSSIRPEATMAVYSASKASKHLVKSTSDLTTQMPIPLPSQPPVPLQSQPPTSSYDFYYILTE